MLVRGGAFFIIQCSTLVKSTLGTNDDGLENRTQTHTAGAAAERAASTYRFVQRYDESTDDFTMACVGGMDGESVVSECSSRICCKPPPVLSLSEYCTVPVRRSGAPLTQKEIDEMNELEGENARALLRSDTGHVALFYWGLLAPSFLFPDRLKALLLWQEL